MERAEVILDYWFGTPTPEGWVAPERAKRWFDASAETDRDIRERFGADFDRAVQGELDDWARTPRGRLALVVLLDQFSRNIHRGTLRAFAADPRAQRLCLDGLAQGDDQALTPVERTFLLLPLEHAEDRELQRESVAGYERLVETAPASLRPRLAASLDWARRHQDVIERFGRFPHRNEILGRVSTPEEREFLAHHGGFL